ncbi:hypothetical protein DF186_14350, partial [Enterococcus hirae]
FFLFYFFFSVIRVSFFLLICCFLKSKFEFVLKIMDSLSSDSALNSGDVDYEFEFNEISEV